MTNELQIRIDRLMISNDLSAGWSHPNWWAYPPIRIGFDQIFMLCGEFQDKMDGQLIHEFLHGRAISHF
jgi:hypothetical protein